MEASQERSRLLGEMFVEKGLLTEAELEDVLVEQARTGRRIGQIVVARGLISGPALTTVLTEQLGVELETEHGFGSGLWSQIARRHERGLGLAVESLAGNHLTGDAEEIRARAEEPAEEPTLEELARQLGALEARLGTERATREQVENELAQARRELAELAGGEPTSGFLIYVSLEGGFALLESGRRASGARRADSRTGVRP